MKIFNKIVIIGTGLIGGSLGLDLRKKHLVGKITGLSRRKKNVEFSKKIGVIDCSATSLDVVADADLVILATPIEVIIDIGLKISKKIKKDCVVIDVGSSKEAIVSKLSRVIPNFVCCHPLAGSEKKGVTNFESGIFNGSTCIITPNAKTNSQALRKVKLLWKKLGSQVIILTPKKHDQILAFISHLPHVLAFALMNTISEKFLALSSGGLKDSTRIAASDPELWSQILLSNRGNLLSAISSFQRKLDLFKLVLRNKNNKLLMKILEAAKEKRKKLG